VTRIVSGSARGRRLLVPAAGTRPTSDRAREAVFSALESQLGGLGGRVVVDLYAGSGALGLEALSRGALRVDLVEASREAVTVLRQNIEAVGLVGGWVHPVKVERWVRDRDPEIPPADLVFADPPYTVPDHEIEAVLTELAGVGGLAAGCVVVVERPTRGAAYTWPPCFAATRDRSYGEATMWFGRFDSVTAC